MYLYPVENDKTISEMRYKCYMYVKTGGGKETLINYIRPKFERKKGDLYNI